MLTAPPAHVRSIDLMALKFDLHIGLELLSSGPAAPGTAGERAEEAPRESGLGRPVLATRRRLLHQISRDDLVKT